METQTMIDRIRAFSLDTVRATLAACNVPESAKGDLETRINTTVMWLDAVRSELIATIAEIDDEEDLATTIAVQYVELKSRWIAFNTKMNYERFRKGDCDRLDMCKGACASTLLGHIEELLSTEDVDKITDFLAAPIRNAA